MRQRQLHRLANLLLLDVITSDILPYAWLWAVNMGDYKHDILHGSLHDHAKLHRMGMPLSPILHT